MSLHLPAFPQNELGLQRGSVLKVKLALKVRWPLLRNVDRIPIGFDGEHVKSCGLGWSIEQLVKEIKEDGFWEICDQVIDLSDPLLSAKFAREIEHINLC